MRTRKFMIAGWLVLATGCSEQGKTEAPVVDAPVPMQERMQALFESVLDGVQLIEANDKLDKTAGEIDSTTAPPSYRVAYEGCVNGFVVGHFCVRDGSHQIDVVAPDIHIIRSVDQQYVLDGFGSVPGYQLTGTLESHVTVSVDTTAQTTEVDGSANGVLQVAGDIDGNVDVALEIGGGRNYTESAATPIIVTGTFTHAGETFAVEGGFQRE